MNNDEEHLRLLAIFHFVFAGLVAVSSLLPLMHVFFGILILNGGLTVPGGAEPPASFGVFVIVFGMVFITAGLTLSALVAFSGRALQKRRKHGFCLVVAGISCILMPLGTVLGVFTIVVLKRDSVKALFAARAADEATT